MLKKAGLQALSAAIILFFTVLGQIGWGYFQIIQTQKDVVENKKNIEKKVGEETVLRILSLIEERNSLYENMISNVEENSERNREAIEKNKEYMREEFSKVRDALRHKFRGMEETTLN